MSDPVVIGTPAEERRIAQRECETAGCAWKGQRWDALSSSSGDRCPECRQRGKATGVTVHVGDAERHLAKHGRIVDAAVAGEDVS